MNFRVLGWLALATMLPASVLPLRADDEADARAALKKAQAAQNDAMACRMTMTSTERDTGRVTVMTTEFVKPDAMHTRLEINGGTAMEMVTDGKRTFMRQGADPEMKEAPAHVSSTLLAARKNISLDTLVDAGKGVKLLGHQTVRGVPASVYGFSSELTGVASETRVWVSDKDGCPVQAEAESRGEVKTGAGIGRKTNSHSLTLFDYDPSIRITLPGN